MCMGHDMGWPDRWRQSPTTGAGQDLGQSQVSGLFWGLLADIPVGCCRQRNRLAASSASPVATLPNASPVTTRAAGTAAAIAVRTAGIRVAPPVKNTADTASGVRPAILKTSSTRERM